MHAEKVGCWERRFHQKDFYSSTLQDESMMQALEYKNPKNTKIIKGITLLIGKHVTNKMTL